LVHVSMSLIIVTKLEHVNKAIYKLNDLKQIALHY